MDSDINIDEMDPEEIMKLQQQIVEDNKKFLNQYNCYKDLNKAKNIFKQNEQHAQKYNVESFDYKPPHEKRGDNNG